MSRVLKSPSLLLFSLAAATLLLARKSEPEAESDALRSQSPTEEKEKESGSAQDRLAGAGAESPSQIPTRGWWSVLKRAMVGFSSDRVMANAAAVTFYVLLALFPAVAALISIYGIFADPIRLKEQLQDFIWIMPAGGVSIVMNEVNSLTAKGPTALSWGAVIGIAVSIWSANAGVKAFFDALNIVYHEEEKRSYLRLTLASLCFTIGLVAFAIIAVSMVVAAPIVLNEVGLGFATDLLIRYGRWIALFVVVDTVLAFLYRFGPSRNRARWRWVTWGSAFAAAAWIAVSILFSIYVANFGSYDKTYGSLGAAVGFMTWIWISSIVVLMGAEINAELEQQTRRDSTVGGEKPLGTRGAYKADVKPSGAGAAY